MEILLYVILTLLCPVKLRSAGRRGGPERSGGAACSRRSRACGPDYAADYSECYCRCDTCSGPRDCCSTLCTACSEPVPPTIVLIPYPYPVQMQSSKPQIVYRNATKIVQAPPKPPRPRKKCVRKPREKCVPVARPRNDCVVAPPPPRKKCCKKVYRQNCRPSLSVSCVKNTVIPCVPQPVYLPPATEVRPRDCIVPTAPPVRYESECDSEDELIERPVLEDVGERGGGEWTQGRRYGGSRNVPGYSNTYLKIRKTKPIWRKR